MCEYLSRILFCDTTDHIHVQQRKQAGQDIMVFTCVVTVSIIILGSTHSMVLRLGGMCSLVNSIDWFGSLMAESGLVDFLACAFRGVEHKKYVDMKKRNFHSMSVHCDYM